MVGPQYDCLANPLGAVRSSFEKAVSSGLDPKSLNGKDWGALDLFGHFIADQTVRSQVPILNRSSIQCLPPNSLVRFQGMIQDMLGNEFYAGAYKDGTIWRTNKYTDPCQVPVVNSPDMQIWERRLLYCVPIPGRNLWTESSAQVAIKRCTQGRDKRPRTTDEVIDHMDFQVSENEIRSSPVKKMREDGGFFSALQSQKSSLEGTSSIINKVPEDLSCLVKIYDSLDSEFKLNDVVEFFGVLTFDSEPSLDKDNNGEFLDATVEAEVGHFPSSKVPRLHCLIHKKLSAADFLQASPTMEMKPQILKGMREALVKHLTVLLGGDDLAAQFMLFHLLSKVHTRVESVAVGKLSLNLTRLTKESVSLFGPRISEAVQSLLPFTHYIPLTIEYLNTASLAPKKDYELNRLTPGVLQLPEGSHLIVDETQLDAGTLNSVGLDNANLLKNLMEFQKVEYDFQYYKMEMAADVQLLTFSEGKSNIMPADIVIPCHPSSMGSTEVAPAEALEAWRWYLATVRLLPHSIESEMQKVVESDMVAARQADRSIGSEDFSRWLTMARIVSASFGETCLSLEHWRMVMELERLRRERLK